MKNLIYTICFTMLFVASVKAQQDPQYTQYMYNMSVLNPAYATDNPKALNLGGLYRTQWVGFEGAPQTATFFAHAPVSEKIEMGISIVNDEIGDIVNETNTYIDIAYKLQLSENSKLSLGIKAGATFFSTDFSNFQLTDNIPDGAFEENISTVMPNVGAGAFYFTDKMYLGFSIPNFLKSNHIENENGVAYQAVEDIHYFFTGGYVFDLNDNLKFKPAFMAKGVSGVPLSIDLTTNFLLYETVEVGAAYRFGDAVSGLVNFRVLPGLRIGYAYDYTTSNLSSYNSGSHEIMVLFDVNLFNVKSSDGKKRGYDVSPRFF